MQPVMNRVTIYNPRHILVNSISNCCCVVAEGSRRVSVGAVVKRLTEQQHLNSVPPPRSAVVVVSSSPYCTLAVSNIIHHGFINI